MPVEEFDSPSLQQMHQLLNIVRQALEKHEVFLFYFIAVNLQFFCWK